MTSYDIVVHTGDKFGAGTDSKVYITLYGKNGKNTGKIPLKESNNKDPFERNQTDMFRVNGENVGELTKLRIEHDGTGPGAGWFLDRIEVTEVSNPDIKYLAKCNNWLAADEGDRQISRELDVTKQDSRVVKNRSYRVIIYTGTVEDAGTDADVSISLFGDLGQTESIKLKAPKKSFEAGSKDEFTIEHSDLGELKKILIGHNDKGFGAGWFLDRVIVTDVVRERSYEFPCYRWLAKSEDDRQISRYLYPKTVSQNVAYNVTVYTADRSKAGTDAAVYIIMHGQTPPPSDRTLLKNGAFEQASIDKFVIEAPITLSPLTALDIGHDNSGLGPGWFLDKVVVSCPRRGITQTFPCNNWLADNEGDKKIERRLTEDLSLRKTRPPSIPCEIKVYTSSRLAAGTSDPIVMVLYGSGGKSGNIKPETRADALQAGRCAKFKADIADVGIPFKLRVSIDEKTYKDPWHLDRVEIKNLNTNNRYTFRCGKWLSKKEDDRQIIRELPAEGSEITQPLPVVKYIVDVHTGDERNAGTDAKVFINIYGQMGDTGDRPLEYSSTYKDMFEKGHTDSFTVEAVDLKQLEKIRIGHDGTGKAPGWFLEKVVIRSESNDHEPAIFMCNRWLAKGEDDGEIVRVLPISGKSPPKPPPTLKPLPQTIYNVKVKTGDNFQAGTDANVHLQIFGEKGQTDKLALRSANNSVNLFERGHIDNFTLEAYDVGKITHILIGHDGSKPGAGWFLDWVEIEIPSRQEFYRFEANRWLDKNEGDGKIEIILRPVEFPAITYEAGIYTGDIPGASTDANVFLTIYGEFGDSGEHQLINSKTHRDKFERKQEDLFDIKSKPLGRLIKIRIRHDNKGESPAWYLDHVIISDPENIKRYHFICEDWLTGDRNDRMLLRELYALEYLVHQPSVVLPTTPEYPEYYDPYMRNIPYRINLITGDRSGSDIDDKIYLIIYGQHNDTGKVQLLLPATYQVPVTRGHSDLFEVEALDVGLPKKIRIGHDKTGVVSDWFLDRVEINIPGLGQTWIFPCGRWIQKNKYFDQYEVELLPQGTGNNPMASYIPYELKVHKSQAPNAGLDANILIQLPQS